ncbi:MAG: SOS response-associated peptidase, partial [Desulfobacterales bacterium]|nr:SOS response-associated peptidase [Desulfobacterales bacterium]
PIDRAACEATANYNVAPSQEVLAIVRRDRLNWLDKFHWGLVPFWARDVAIGSRLINARAETVAAKPSFRQAFQKRRCLILADGFYEWKGPKGQKQPMFITLPSAAPFAFAGLWETWAPKGEAEAAYRSCTIITTPAGESLREIHHRMPAVLKPESYDRWLDPQNRDAAALQATLQSEIYREFVSRPVSLSVNAVGNNAPANIAPLTQRETEF